MHSVLEMALSHPLDINRAIGASQYLPVPKTSLQLLHTFSSCPIVKYLLVHKQGSPLRYQDGTTLLFKSSTEISAMFNLLNPLFQLLVPRFITKF